MGVRPDAFGNVVGNGIVDSIQPDGASAYGYRNGADIDSDNFNPASAYGYRNGLDIDSDRVSAVRMRSEAMYGLASEGPIRLGGPTSAQAVAAWSSRIDSGIVDASENLARAQRFLDMDPMADAQAAASRFYGNVPMRSDWDEDALVHRRSTDPSLGTMGPKRTGPDAFTSGIAKALSARETEQSTPWLLQKNAAASSIGDKARDYFVEVGRTRPVLGGFGQAVTYGLLGGETNLEAGLAAFPLLLRLGGRGGAAITERVADDLNPRLVERLEAWRAYQGAGGQLDLQGWTQRTQGAPWGTGFKSGYAEWSSRIDSVHGNSLLSDRTAHLYRLEDAATGDLVKWGVTQDLKTRYSGGLLLDKQIFEVTSGSRIEIIRMERDLVETQPGPWNREPWAGKKR